MSKGCLGFVQKVKEHKLVVAIGLVFSAAAAVAAFIANYQAIEGWYLGKDSCNQYRQDLEKRIIAIEKVSGSPEVLGFAELELLKRDIDNLLLIQKRNTHCFEAGEISEKNEFLQNRLMFLCHKKLQQLSDLYKDNKAIVIADEETEVVKRLCHTTLSYCRTTGTGSAEDIEILQNTVKQLK